MGPNVCGRSSATIPEAFIPWWCATPRSGRRALYVNRGFTRRILGLPDIESRGLLNLLLEHSEQSSFQVRWTWSKGDVALWDNRCTMHYAARDYRAEERVMYRVTLKGSRPLAA